MVTYTKSVDRYTRSWPIAGLQGAMLASVGYRWYMSMRW